MIKGSKFMLALAATSSVLALGATSAEAQRRNRDRAETPAQPTTPQPSREFVTAYQPIQPLLAASNWAAADALLPAIKAVAVSEYERYLAARADLSIAIGLNDVPRQAAAATALIDSNGIPAAEQVRMYTLGAQLAYNTQAYAVAAPRAKRAIELGATADNMPLLFIDALIRSNQLDQAVAEATAMRTSANAAGRKLPEAIYGQVARALQEADRTADVVGWVTDRAADYPTQANFRNAILIYIQSVPDDRGTTIDALRLMTAADAMNDRRFYIEYASSLSEEALPNAALVAIAAGRAANVITEADVSGQATLALVKENAEANIASDRASLPGAERRAAANPASRPTQRVADGYLSYDNFAKAEELYMAAKAKTDADMGLLDTRIGITRYLAGNSAGALEAFNAVQGPRAGLAKLWIAFIQSRTPAAAPAPEAAAPAAQPAG